MRSTLFYLFLSASLCAQSAPAQSPPLNGYITQIESPTNFQVNGITVLMSASTPIVLQTRDGVATSGSLSPFFGEEISVYGKVNSKLHTVAATRIVLYELIGEVAEGTAIIDKLPTTPAAKPGEIIVRADGYLLQLTPKTALTSDLPDPSIHGLHTNVWITYHGISQPSGMILVDKASIRNNVIGDKEDHLLEKTDYDPEKIALTAKQSAVSKYFRGVDPKQVPPYINDAMQARIDRIGDSLIPAYQKELPESDPTRIVFHFQLVDEKKWYSPITWPSGVVLVPRQTVERLPNDSQLAAILADNIAVAIEKQTFRRQPGKDKMTAAVIAGEAGGFFVPGLGLATGLATAKAAHEIELRNEEQSGRVSLTLLFDAGYDLHEAPLAWWRLSASNLDKLIESSLPPRAVNLYSTIGNVWTTLPSNP